MADEKPRGKAPAFQWYPGDFRRDVALQACSFGARSLWREMIDLMHDGEPYGHLSAGGVAISLTQLARIVGVSARDVKRWTKELADRNVYSVTDDGVIYSRRMVRDHEVRLKRAAGGAKGGNPALIKDTEKVGDKVNLPPNLNPTPASAVCSLLSATTDERKTDADASEAGPREVEAPAIDPQVVHATLAPAIRDYLWLSTKPPPTAGAGWNMGRELALAKTLMSEDERLDIETMAAVIEHARAVLEFRGDEPLTMKIFNVKHRRDRLNACVGHVQKLQARAAAERIDEPRPIGADVRRAAAAATQRRG